MAKRAGERPAAVRRRTDRRSRSARAEGRNGREELLRAAAEVFAAHGFRQASVDEIAERAGYSKGALYWHFESKEDIFLALLEERIDAPTRRLVDLLRTAPPERDMSVEASRLFVELVSRERELLLLDHEYWSQAMRDSRLRARYARRRREMRAAVGQALTARLEHLGTPAPGARPEELATAIMSLAAGLAQQKLVDPKSVPDELLGDTIVLIYRGLVASAVGTSSSSTGTTTTS
jgi:AcrR family transcriptional regulator